MWKEGTLEIGASVFTYCIKVYGEGSDYGIDEGRISKLMLKCDGKVVVNYDRGWDVEPSDTDAALAKDILIHEYN